MPRYKLRCRGDKYRPVIKVLKVKNGVPTKVTFNGQVYALVHSDHINGRKNYASK
ncbi:hypothetical protein N784_13450 [Pontibacillus litoralis JSM 072002]|uniref:Uncharacterized protein n=1 Tax=Pontibacillus litoralis JSM 072002 TaxID=1385512 RepID=A0A0A5G052_9BACI|nr:hypothetical protein N784_13450 [Pontibacillus litoralis JSM 072002]